MRRLLVIVGACALVLLVLPLASSEAATAPFGCPAVSGLQATPTFTAADGSASLRCSYTRSSGGSAIASAVWAFPSNPSPGAALGYTTCGSASPSASMVRSATHWAFASVSGQPDVRSLLTGARAALLRSSEGIAKPCVTATTTTTRRATTTTTRPRGTSTTTRPSTSTSTTTRPPSVSSTTTTTVPVTTNGVTLEGQGCTIGQSTAGTWLPAEVVCTERQWQVPLRATAATFPSGTALVFQQSNPGSTTYVDIDTEVTNPAVTFVVRSTDGRFTYRAQLRNATTQAVLRTSNPFVVDWQT